MFFFEVDAFSTARAFFFMTRGSPFSVTRSLRVRLRFPSMGSLKVLEEDIVVSWMDSDGWTEEMLDDKDLIFVSVAVQYSTGSGR